MKNVHIYTEANPNPNSMKFVVNFLLIPEGTDLDYASKAAAKGASPLAEALFDFPFVERVFFMNNFVTITKSESVEWIEIVKELKDFLNQFLAAGGPVVNASSLKEFEAIEQTVEGKTDLEKQIISLLDEYVKPAVEGDGGAINFRSFEEGIVKVELRGSCSGCPSSTLTLKSGIENLLKRMVPEVQAVEAIGM